MKSNSPEQSVQTKNVVLLVSITQAGEGEKPLVAQRITVDGKIVDAPFFLVVGDADNGKSPLTAGSVPAASAVTYAQVLSAMSASFYESALALLQNALDRSIEQHDARQHAEAKTKGELTDILDYTGV